MGERQPDADRREPALREEISQIHRTLETLRERLRELGATEGAAAPPPPSGKGDQTTVVSADVLGGIDEVLAIPPSGFPPAEVFGHAMDRTARLLDADRAMLFVLDPERGELVPTAARGFRRDDLGGLAVQSGEGLVGRALREGRPIAYSRPAEASPSDPFVARFPVREAVAVPIKSDGVVLGVLFAGRRGRAAPFGADDLRLLVLIADRIATAFSHQRLVERTAEHLGRLRELEGFSGHAVVGRDLADTLARACEVGCRLLGARVAALGIADASGALQLGAGSGIPRGVAEAWRVEPHTGLAAEMFATERPLVWRDDGEGHADVEPFVRDLGIGACLVVPLRVHGRVMGALYLGDARPREFMPEEIEAAQVLASLAALAVENERLYGEVQSALAALTTAQERLVQTEKTRALGGMAGGVAHEFNNVLAIILGKTQLMLARAPDDPVRDGLGQIEEAAWRAADIVRRLQGYAATRSDEPAAPVNVSTLVQDAITLTRALWKDEAEARGLRIDVVADLEEQPVVVGNAAELREAVTNLVLNAIDAMPRGGRLALATRRRDGGVEVVVSDSGEGMTDEVRRRIFEPFFSTRTPTRTGLGLSVVHGIVTRHRGRIDVISEAGRGTRVTLWLPAAPILAPAAPVPPAPAPAPQGPGSILVIEDEEQIRQTLVSAFGDAGHAVEAAEDGLAGLARFQRGSFDVVVTDLSLPERSGLEVAQAVKRLRPGTPVVLISGWGHLLDPARLRESGVDLTLVKPFRLDRVLAVLEDALRLRPTR
jgi:signal transduction histidine kinase